jgi:hypothetical protein
MLPHDTNRQGRIVGHGHMAMPAGFGGVKLVLADYRHLVFNLYAQGSSIDLLRLVKQY